MIDHAPDEPVVVDCKGRAAPAFVYAHVESGRDRAFDGLPDPVAVLRQLYDAYQGLPQDQMRTRAFEEFNAIAKRYKATGEVSLRPIVDVSVEEEVL